MDRGAWQAVVCGVTRVRSDRVTKSLPPPSHVEKTRREKTNLESRGERGKIVQEPREKQSSHMLA